MITFTSDTVGRPRPSDPPGACPRCQNRGDVEISLRTERVVFYRCPECGHMWVVKPAQPA